MSSQDKAVAYEVRRIQKSRKLRIKLSLSELLADHWRLLPVSVSFVCLAGWFVGRQEPHYETPTPTSASSVEITGMHQYL